MGDATSHNSQFTQTLLLFVRLLLDPFLTPTDCLQQSQTQSGRRYTPHLTRFYSSLGPYMLMSLIQESLTELGVKWKPPMEVDEGEGTEKFFRMRIGGHDKRRVMFKGWVVLEHFSYAEHKGSFCVMQRDRVRVNAPIVLFRPLVPLTLMPLINTTRVTQSRGDSYGKR